MYPDAQDELAPFVDELLLERPYRRVRRIGRGGMSAVYAVRHQRLLKDFALKFPLPYYAAQASFVDRARVEAQALGRLRHPNVVEVVDFWVGPRAPCIVLELLHGRSLAEELALRSFVPAGEALRLACDALSALSEAHALGLVHRDLKPENLFLHERGELLPTLKVLDFGLARVLPDASPLAPRALEVATTTGARVGSPRFMSPEAWSGERVGPRADVYSLAAILSLMLTGRHPSRPGEPGGELPSRVAPQPLPRGLDEILARALSERAEDRPDATELRSELRSVVSF